jgi:hypothetical protein
MLGGFDVAAMAVIANSIGADLGLGFDKIGLVFGFSSAGMMQGAIF